MQAGAEPSYSDKDTNGTLIRRAQGMDDFEGEESPNGPLDFAVNLEEVKRQRQLEESGAGVRCPAGHLLKKQQGRTNYCDDCRETGTAYRCTKCNFDLCQGCYQKNGGESSPDEEKQQESAGRPSCPKGHALKNERKRTNTCDGCNKRGTAWRCAKCDFDLCESCFKEKGPKAEHEQEVISHVRCPDGHPLKHQRIRNHTCDECSRKGTAWRCATCDFDLCESCFKEKEPDSESGSRPRCPDGHPLKKKRMRNNYCNNCRETGTDYRCNKCDYDLCSECYQDACVSP